MLTSTSSFGEEPALQFPGLFIHTGINDDGTSNDMWRGTIAVFFNPEKGTVVKSNGFGSGGIGYKMYPMKKDTRMWKTFIGSVTLINE